ncbi:ATP-binding response regulator [Paraburkholderia sp. 35.1]|uniref:ATP-binding response regulator n=1 Tax=Paraburkholderia sp. 35.1 TaxID=2991058 RepID=UPI003D1A4184
MKSANFPAAQQREPRRAGSALRELLSSLAETLTFPSPFDDADLEREFLEDHGRRFARFRRASGVLGLFVWGCYLWVDFYVAGQAPAFQNILPALLLFRGIGVAAIACAVALSFHRSFAREFTAHVVLMFPIATVAMSLLGAELVAPTPFKVVPYLFSLDLVLFFQFGFFQFRPKAACWFAVSVVLAVIVLQIIFRFLSTWDLFIAVMWLSNVIVIGLGVNVHAERHSRERFFAEKALAVSNRHLEILNETMMDKNKALEISRDEQMAKTKALITLKEQQKRAAEDANFEKSSFLAAATHDLRQPMHALNLFLAAAEEAAGRDDSEESRKLITQARKSSVVMARLFDAVLDLSRLESGKVRPDYRVIDLSPLVHELVEQSTPLSANAGVSLRLRCPVNARIWVRSDPYWIRRILANLISNAVKYADLQKGGQCGVLVGVVRGANRVRIDVVDNGIGIAQRYWDAIFRPFFQIGNTERDRERGLGLGLSTVNAMISMLDEHRIELKSIEGRGSRFSIELPVCHSPMLTSVYEPPAEPASTARAISGLYVLLIEDDRLVRAATEALFHQWGVLFDSANSVAQLNEILDSIERYPDLIITDYTLADSTTAYDVSASAHAKLGRSIPCLIITGEVGAINLEIDSDKNIITKPVTAEILKTSILKMIAIEPSQSSASEHVR